MAVKIVFLNTRVLNSNFKKRWFGPLIESVHYEIDDYPTSDEGLRQIQHTDSTFPDIIVMYIGNTNDLRTAERMAEWAKEHKVKFGYITLYLEAQIKHLPTLHCDAKKFPRGRFLYHTTEHPKAFHDRIWGLLQGQT